MLELSAFPETVKIGAAVYRIEFKTRLCSDTNQRLLGQIDYAGRLIELDPDRDTQSIRDSLLHEILHGCLEHTEQHQEEEFVGRLASALAAVLLDNPKLLELWK